MNGQNLKKKVHMNGYNFRYGKYMNGYVFKLRLVYECGGIQGLKPNVRTKNHGKLAKQEHNAEDPPRTNINVGVNIDTV